MSASPLTHTTPKPTDKQRGAQKLSRIPIKIPVEQNTVRLPKPPWIRTKISLNNQVGQLKKQFKEKNIITVCAEANCPNLSECYSHGTASFMIMGDKCTRRCSFCDVAHGRPDPLDPEEPNNLADVIYAMKLKHVVITSVDRDDLRDGGASHFCQCIQAVRTKNPGIKVEILVPDFRGRGRMEKALNALANTPPDIFNHNIETVPRLYPKARPGSDYAWSLTLLKNFGSRFPNIPTKSGMMLGLGETPEEIQQVLVDLYAHGVTWLTLGQYLQPSPHHFPVVRYVTPEEFNQWRKTAQSIGFTHVASGPLVRSSYHADRQAEGDVVS